VSAEKVATIQHRTYDIPTPETQWVYPADNVLQ